MRRHILDYVAFRGCPPCCVGRNIGHLQRIGIFHKYQYNDTRILNFHSFCSAKFYVCTTLHLVNLCFDSELMVVTYMIVTDIFI